MWSLSARIDTPGGGLYPKAENALITFRAMESATIASQCRRVGFSQLVTTCLPCHLTALLMSTNAPYSMLWCCLMGNSRKLEYSGRDVDISVNNTKAFGVQGIAVERACFAVVSAGQQKFKGGIGS